MKLKRLIGKLGRREREQIWEIDRDHKRNSEEESERELKLNWHVHLSSIPSVIT